MKRFEVLKAQRLRWHCHWNYLIICATQSIKLGFGFAFIWIGALSSVSIREICFGFCGIKCDSHQSSLYLEFVRSRRHWHPTRIIFDGGGNNRKPVTIELLEQFKIYSDCDGPLTLILTLAHITIFATDYKINWHFYAKTTRAYFLSSKYISETFGNENTAREQIKSVLEDFRFPFLLLISTAWKSHIKEANRRRKKTNLTMCEYAMNECTRVRCLWQNDLFLSNTKSHNGIIQKIRHFTSRMNRIN